MIEATQKPHRILSPRLVFCIGTTAEDGTQNIIPITNVTSVSVDPCQVLVAIYKEWQTCANLQIAKGFTLSLASKKQLELVWKLGAKYSGYQSDQPKVEEFKDNLDLDFSAYGPVLKDALGWVELEIVSRPDSSKGDHLMIVGECKKAMVNPDHYDAEINPLGTPKPLMQWEHNNFSSAEAIFSIEYFRDPGF